MSHLPIGCFKTYEEYRDQTEIKDELKTREIINWKETIEDNFNDDKLGNNGEEIPNYPEYDWEEDRNYGR